MYPLGKIQMDGLYLQTRIRKNYADPNPQHRQKINQLLWSSNRNKQLLNKMKWYSTIFRKEKEVVLFYYLKKQRTSWEVQWSNIYHI